MTSADFAATPMALRMTQKHGWNRATWQRLAAHAEEERAALKGRHGYHLRCSILNRTRTKLLREFSFSADEIRSHCRELTRHDVMIEQRDPERMTDLLLCLTVLDSLRHRQAVS